MNHSWHQLSIATQGSGRARIRSGLAICEPAISELRAHVLRSGLPPTSTATLSATGPWMTLRPVNNPAAGVAQRTRTGRHFSGMTRRDLAFVHLHRSIKAAHLKAIVRAALERDPDPPVAPIRSTWSYYFCLSVALSAPTRAASPGIISAGRAQRRWGCSIVAP